MVPYDPDRHDADMVASLIFEADPEMTSLVMGGREKAVERFKTLMSIGSSPWSAENITVAMIGDELAGVLVGSLGREKEVADRKAAEWGRALGLPWLLRSVRIGMRMAKAVSRDIGDDEYYPLALTVREEFRGQGVGSQMLRWIMDRHGKVVIDVNIRKRDAVRFYERNGFRVEAENTMRHKGRVYGNYSMRNAPGNR